MDLSGFDELVAEGRNLLRAPDGNRTQHQFLEWTDRVCEWLASRGSPSALAEWSSLSMPRLDLVGPGLPRTMLMQEYREILGGRLSWLSRFAQPGGVRRSGPDGQSRPRVFVVHGHDRGTAEAVARLLERLKLGAIVLHEQPNRGQSVLDKIIEHSDVDFAVVLLTADDRGGTRMQAAPDQKPRARQNVVLELGWFLGRLGRERVCVLYEDGVELPSDYAGILYTPLDPAGAWRGELAREMKAAGLPIDMNDVF